ncbi:MAG: BamA/TamA family outer membrane protein [Ignavibacteriales bacterium]|nr:BamA/TamA family outer membrane protein [Ignavibacteriales bacterium]
MPGLKYALFLTFLVTQSADAQSSVFLFQPDSVTIAANPEFQASSLHRFLFGSLWRDTWTTPVKVEILNLDSSAGILTFDTLLIRSHQGIVTRSLLFKDKNGNAQTFTPNYQDSASSLPQELSILLPRDIIDDQMSTLNPFASLVVAPILQAAGLAFRESRLISLPDNKDFDKNNLQAGGRLGILEGPWRIPFTNIASPQSELFETSSILESLENDLHNRVDELHYLKARLIDILLGDWDRSADQWQWLKVQTPTSIIWEPVPLAHRQALVRLNGLLPLIADLAFPELEHCGENISSVENTTLTGRTLDRRLLISFPKQTWDSLANWIQIQISDSVLIQSISKLPVPILEKEGKSILQILQARRAQLPMAASEFYKLSSAYVEIHGSNKAERVEIRRIGRHMVSVALYDRVDTSQTPLYQRLFHDDFTKEIRLLLLDGDDKATIEGEENGTMKIIVDGGSGKNELVDMSKSRRVFSNLNLFASAGAVFYNNNSVLRTKMGSNTPVIRNWGSEWSFSPWLDINPDDGLFIGGGPVYTQYGYRMEPYTKQISVRAGVATETGRYRLDATGEFRDWFRGISTFLQFHASQLDLSNFFGLGNETTYSPSLDHSEFYKVDQRQVFFRATVDFAIAANTSAEFGSTIKLIDNNPKPGTLLDALQLSYYNKSLTFLNLSARIQADSRDADKLPTRGLFMKAEVSYLPKMFDNANTFYKLRCETRTYFTPVNIQALTIAVRAAGEKIWGNHPFFESAFLGGNESLRGFERQRFAGDASLQGGMELRARVAQIPFLVPLWAGISGFVETGSVFIDGEQSHNWHNAVGGGVWFSIIKPEYLVSFSFARSKDEVTFYATLGFTF